MTGNKDYLKQGAELRGKDYGLKRYPYRKWNRNKGVLFTTCKISNNFNNVDIYLFFETGEE